MKILSLFDGMSCGAIAFTKMGIPIDRYVAFEIDKYATQVSKHNFPYIEQRGDVFKADFTEFSDFDFVIGGSPCTYWSIAQKNNRETEASGLGWELFSQYVRAVHEAEPKYFLYENNKSMSKEIKASITATFGFEPIGINSALVSAQNRQRLYWVGKRNEDGTYSKVDIEQPEDRGILLRDILDNATAWQEKAYALTTRRQGAIPEDTLEKHRHTMVAEPVRIGDLPNERGEISGSQATRIYAVDGKSVNLVANGGGQGAKTGLYAVPIEEILPFVEEKIPKIVDKYGYLPEMFNPYNAAEIIEKSPTITACSNRQSNSGQVMCVLKSDGKTYPVYEVLNGLITIKDKRYPIKLADGFYIIRKLTVSECKRLQTVPEWYDFSVISNSQAYKCLGNGWTVDVIVWLMQSAMGVFYYDV